MGGLLKCDKTVLCTTTRKAGECQGSTIVYDAAFDWYVTCTLIDCFRHQDWVLVLSPSVHMVYEVSACKKQRRMVMDCFIKIPIKVFLLGLKNLFVSLVNCS